MSRRQSGEHVNIGIVGCGFVFDIYMRTRNAHPELDIVGVYDLVPERSRAVSETYGVRVFDSFEQMLADSEVETIVNLTSIGSHYEVSRRAIEAGKHVYTEKPITPDLQGTDELFALAERFGVRVCAAPSNLFSDSIRTVLREVKAGSIGDPLLVYAELDDNPIHLMGFEDVVSPSGAPWPLADEILAGCTFEHIGYHLVWICALLGPAVSLSAFSAELIEDKTEALPGLSGTPDYSVANLTFEGGAVARVTCSVVAPRDHRIRVVGRLGQISTDGYRQYRSPVQVERFTRTSLTARKFRSVRQSRSLGWLTGMRGRRVRLERNWKSEAVEGSFAGGLSPKFRLAEWLRRREVYAQDKFVGLAEMAADLRDGVEQFPPADFLRHVNELTILTQNAFEGKVARPKTSFKRFDSLPVRQSC